MVTDITRSCAIIEMNKLEQELSKRVGHESIFMLRKIKACLENFCIVRKIAKPKERGELFQEHGL